MAADCSERFEWIRDDRRRGWRQKVRDERIRFVSRWIRDERLVLRVRCHDQTRVLRPYLQHLESVTDEMELRRRELRLYANTGTLTPHWASVPFIHPAMLDTVAMDPELKTQSSKPSMSQGDGEDEQQAVAQTQEAWAGALVAALMDLDEKAVSLALGIIGDVGVAARVLKVAAQVIGAQGGGPAGVLGEEEPHIV